MKVFVGQVIAAGKTDFSVNHSDLAVVAVIEKDIESGYKGIEHTALQTAGLHSFYKIHVDKAKASHVIIKNADLNTGLCPFHQNCLNLMPAFRVLDGMIFHENKLLRFGQFSLLGLKTFDCVIVIGDPCLFIDRISRVIFDVSHNTGDSAGEVSDMIIHVFIGRQKGEKNFVQLHITPAHLQRVTVQADQKKQDCSHNRDKHDKHDPCHPYRRSLVASIDHQHQYDRKNMQHNIDPACLRSGKLKKQEDDDHFNQDRQDDQDHTDNTVFDGRFLFHRASRRIVCSVCHFFTDFFTVFFTVRRSIICVERIFL